MNVCGIDPGLGGAIAAVGPHGLLEVDDMPVEPVGGAGTVKRRVCAAQLATMLRGYRERHQGDEWIVVVERVHSGGGQGVASVFSLGDSAGVIRGVVQTLGMRFELVTPGQWKQALKLTKDKEVSRTLAIARWPAASVYFSRKKDHGRAEAALIAQYGLDVFA